MEKTGTQSTHKHPGTVQTRENKELVNIMTMY